MSTLPHRGDSEALVLPRSRALTTDDLKALPDDGHRYELIDGALLVSPAPAMRHQRAVRKLAVLLDHHCPTELEVFFAPFNVELADDTVMQPDVSVVRRADLTERGLPVAPVLAVEVLSPSTRRIDLTVKRSRYEEAGCASYWVIDPDEPSIIAWGLHDGVYVEVAHVTGTDAFTIDAPFAVSLTPAELLD
ncbi:MAG TPA: Uma2 family endonuclease [Nocardioidaceae bacterium]|nr:Uma2 family endonuclease [Nocardioidaceae bacterium]